MFKAIANSRDFGLVIWQPKAGEEKIKPYIQVNTSSTKRSDLLRLPNGSLFELRKQTQVVEDQIEIEEDNRFNLS